MFDGDIWGGEEGDFEKVIVQLGYIKWVELRR